LAAVLSYGKLCTVIWLTCICIALFEKGASRIREQELGSGYDGRPTEMRFEKLVHRTLVQVSYGLPPVRPWSLLALPTPVLSAQTTTSASSGPWTPQWPLHGPLAHNDDDQHAVYAEGDILQVCREGHTREANFLCPWYSQSICVRCSKHLLRGSILTNVTLVHPEG